MRRPVVALLFALSVVQAGQPVAAKSHGSEPQQTTEAPNQGASPIRVVPDPGKNQIPNPEPEPKSQSTQTEKTNHRDWIDWIGLACTIALTGATLALAIYTAKLWRETANLAVEGQKQFKLIQDEFIATHRPRLRCRHFRGPGCPVNQYSGFDWFFKVINCGESEALDIEIRCFSGWFRSRDQAQAALNWDEVVPIKVDRMVSGQSRSLKIHHSNNLPQDTRDMTYAFYVFGLVTYSDLARINRNSGFLIVPHMPGSATRENFEFGSFNQANDDNNCFED